jgi:hypothetical protein
VETEGGHAISTNGDIVWLFNACSSISTEVGEGKARRVELVSSGVGDGMVVVRINDEC